MVSLEPKVAIGASESVRISVSEVDFPSLTLVAVELKRCRPRSCTKGGWYDMGGGSSAGPLFTCGILCLSLGFSPTTRGSLRIIRQVSFTF